MEENAEDLDNGEAAVFRSVAARANYLAQDRPDIMFAVKEICRSMSAPTVGSMKALKRLGRYLIEHPRKVFCYEMQGRETDITAYSDSDWGGCRKTGKSTSGGVLLRRKHFVRSWSSTQKCVTLSSGEAELVALVKTSTELIGVLQLAADWGEDLTGEVLVDSAAALGTVRRKGCGKLRHVRVGNLWV